MCFLKIYIFTKVWKMEDIQRIMNVLLDLFFSWELTKTETFRTIRGLSFRLQYSAGVLLSLGSPFTST